MEDLMSYNSYNFNNVDYVEKTNSIEIMLGDDEIATYSIDTHQFDKKLNPLQSKDFLLRLNNHNLFKSVHHYLITKIFMPFDDEEFSYIVKAFGDQLVVDCGFIDEAIPSDIKFEYGFIALLAPRINYGKNSYFLLNIIEIIIDFATKGTLSSLKEKRENETNNSKIKTYLIKDERTNFIKIGKSKSPLQREKTLQAEYPLLSILFVIDLNVESLLHSDYEIKRVRGEWFNLTENDIIDIYNKYKDKITFNKTSLKRYHTR